MPTQPRILIAAADERVHAETATRLRQEGYDCDYAGDAAAALAALASETYDLAIVVIVTPGPQEFALLRTLQSSPQHVPIIASTHDLVIPTVMASLSASGDPARSGRDRVARSRRQGRSGRTADRAGTPDTAVAATGHDAAALHRLETALQEAEAKFQLLLNAALDVMLIIDGESGQIRHVNRAARHVLGYTPEMLVGQHFSCLLPAVATPATADTTPVDVHGAVFASQEVLCADGSICPIDLTATVIPWDTGEAIFVTLRDITERKQIEEDLRDSEERFRHLIEGSIQGVCIAQGFQPLFMNQAYATIFGYRTPDEILRRGTLVPLVAPHERERLRHYQEALLRGEEAPSHYEYQGYHKDGAIMWLESRVRVINWRGTQAIQATTVDITERKRAEAALYKAKDELEKRVAERTADLWRTNVQLRREITEREQAERELKVRAHQQTAVVALSQSALIDAEPGKLLHDAVALISQTLHVEYSLVLECTPQGEELLFSTGTGWPEGLVGHVTVDRDQDALAGYTLHANVPVVVEDFLTETRFRAPALFQEHGVRSGLSVIIHSRLDNQPFGLLGAYAAQPRSYTQDDLHFLQAMANVLAQAMERKRTEEALRQSTEQQRQLQKMEALGRLAGGVAHDFNNLLTIILGYSDLALQHRPEDDRLYSGLVQIRKAGERGSELTRHLLAFSRKQPLQPVVLNLNTVLTDVEKMLQRLLGADIDIVLATDRALGSVQADPGQIEQVLLNLAVNARDAMPQGGTLTIETTNVTLAEALPAGMERMHPGAYVLLTVSDTGGGMDADTQAHIFEPFFTTKAQGKGTGLGLSTVYGIVEQSGGQITVTSAPDQGTTFRVYLPRVQQRPTALTPRSTPFAPGQGSETILLVEDEPGVRALLSTSLQQYGYIVLEAEHGAAALQLSGQHAGPIQLLVTDIVMPQLSGPELAVRLKATRPEIRTLFLSGYTGETIDHASISDSTTMLLLKPIVPSAFERAVRTLLDAPAPS